jgi:hypothetical protein
MRPVTAWSHGEKLRPLAKLMVTSYVHHTAAFRLPRRSSPPAERYVSVWLDDSVDTEDLSQYSFVLVEYSLWYYACDTTQR